MRVNVTGNTLNTASLFTPSLPVMIISQGKIEFMVE